MGKDLGVTVIIYGLLSAYVIGAFLLKSFPNQVAFNDVQVFVGLMLVSLIWLVVLLVKGQQPIPWFGDIVNKREVSYTAMGVAGVLAWVTVAAYLNLPYVMMIGGIGVVIFAVLFATKSIIAAFVVHGTYNGIIILKQAYPSASVISQVPQVLYVPHFNATIASLTGTMSNIIWQFVLTAPAEEYFKVAIASAIMTQKLVPIKDKWVAAGVAIALWAALHLYLNS